MDGVLIDAPQWHYRALNSALEIFGESISEQEHAERFNGLPTRIKLEMLSDEGRLPRHLHACVESVKQERTLREAAQRCFPRLDHLLMISWLRRKECKVGVATNSIRTSASAMLKFAGLYDDLDVLVTNEDVLHAKPAPDIYRTACASLEVEPRNALVVEDTDIGASAARRAGCQLVMVSSVDQVNSDLLASVFESWEKKSEI